MVHVRPRYSFLRGHTDDGTVGVGEAVLEGRARVVQAALADFEELLVGQDPRRTEHLWQLMYRSTSYPGGSVTCSAISAVDQALWDVLGKHLGAPVHVLLGGAVRDRVRLYRHVNVGDLEAFDPASKEQHLAELARQGRQAVADGFPMVKTALPGPAPAVEGLRGLPGRALRGPARGGRGRGRHRHRLPRQGVPDVLEKGPASVLQPDLAHCGGITQGRKIAAMAETCYAAFARTTRSAR